MGSLQRTIEIETRGRGATEVTAQIAEVVADADLETGLCVVHCMHTSCSLTIQENADPAVMDDLMAWLDRAAPDGDPGHTHTAEGPDDMPSHIRSSLTATGLTIPVSAGRLALGTWQGIQLLEHRTRPHKRRLLVHIA